MNASQTLRAALLTPRSPGAIAVIGVAGPGLDALLAAVLRRRARDEPPVLPVNRPTVCRLVEEGVIVDDVVATRLEGASAELCLHGGVRVVDRALRLLERGGARVVDAASLSGWDDGRSEIERDVDRTLLGVSTRRLTRWLLAQRAILPDFLSRWTTHSPEQREAFLKRSAVAVRVVRGLSLAIVGPPNAGKSTLANRLIGRDRAITSDRPGTTRDWVRETALIDGWPVALTDTAGIRGTNCGIEREAIRRGAAQAAGADGVLVVLDATDRITAEGGGATWDEPPLPEAVEAALADLPPKIPRIITLNKCDRLEAPNAASGVPARREPQGTLEPTNGLRGRRPLRTNTAAAHGRRRISALTGAGVAELESDLGRLFGLNLLDETLPAAFLPRQIARLETLC